MHEVLCVQNTAGDFWAKEKCRYQRFVAKTDVVKPEVYCTSFGNSKNAVTNSFVAITNGYLFLLTAVMLLLTV